MNRIHSFFAALLVFTILPFEMTPLGLSPRDASAQNRATGALGHGLEDQVAREVGPVAAAESAVFAG